MRKMLKSALSVSLVLAMMFSLAMLVSAETAGYKAGDIIEFGEYPQSAVEDEALLAELNVQPLEWVSYGYYSGDGSYGSAEASDYMKYADVELDGKKYRAVTFTEYRPWQSEHDFENSRYIQSDNGYETGTVYWFKFEPIKWKVLNPETGLVICESIIDSQPFQNEVYQNKNEFFLTAHYADPEFTIPANTYSSSSLKVWLEGDFSQTAFNNSESEFISQQAHLISVAESTDADYGFDSDKQAQDTQRMRTGTDYSRIQGLQISETDPGSGNSYWWLGDSVSMYQLESAVCYSGSSNRAIGVTCTYIGVCPAITLDLDRIKYNIVFNNNLALDASPYMSTETEVYETADYAFGDTITMPADPTNIDSAYYTFMGWTDVKGGTEVKYTAESELTMPAGNLDLYAVYERVAVKLVPQEGSTTVIERTLNERGTTVVKESYNDNSVTKDIYTPETEACFEQYYIYGLKMGARDTALATDYVTVQGDGNIVVTPVQRGRLGTSTLVEVFDNVTGERVEYFYVVIFGDLDGNSRLTSADVTELDNEVLSPSWSSSRTKVNYMFKAANLDGNRRITSADSSILGEAVLAAVTIDQITGLAE